MRQTRLIVAMFLTAVPWALASTVDAEEQYKEGDEVVTLKRTQLKVSGAVVAIVPKGQKLAVTDKKNGSGLAKAMHWVGSRTAASYQP